MKDSVNTYRDKLSNLEMQPSPSVWEKIAAANPQPVALPLRQQWLKYSAGAAILVITGLLIWWLPFDSSIERNPMASNDKVVDESGLVNDQAPSAETSPDRMTEHQNLSATQQASDPSEEKPSTFVSDYPIKPATITPSSETTKLPQIIPLPKPVGNASKPVEIKADPNPVPKSNNDVSVSTTTEDHAADPEKTVVPGSLKLFIPNAFNPNGDGINDVFLPIPKENAQVFDYRMQIYSRAGVMLFESIQIEMGWDGTYQGVPFADPVCIYIITYRDGDGASYSNKGTLTIIR